MHLIKRTSSVLLGLAVTVAVLSGILNTSRPLPAAAQAQQVWEVQVGGDIPEEGLSAHTYFPDAVAVHAGDTVRWSFASVEPHNVTYQAGSRPQTYLLPGPGAGEALLGAAWFPTGVASGSQFDGTMFVNSGASFEGPHTPPFELTLTQLGQYLFQCTLHWNMSGTVTVLAQEAPLPETPAQAQDRGQAQWQVKLSAVRNNFARRNPNYPGVYAGDVAVTAGATTIHTVRVGTGVPVAFSILRFQPGEITVRRGDTVVWMNADDSDLHTVTFTSGAAPPGEIDVRPQPSGPPLFVLPANVANAVGGSVYTGQGYINSGILQWGGAPFALTLDAPAGTYTYQCLIHADMKATITVVDDSR